MPMLMNIPGKQELSVKEASDHGAEDLWSTLNGF